MAAKIRVKLHFLGIILQNAYSFYMVIFNFLFVCCQHGVSRLWIYKLYKVCAISLLWVIESSWQFCYTDIERSTGNQSRRSTIVPIFSRSSH